MKFNLTQFKNIDKSWYFVQNYKEIFVVKKKLFSRFFINKKTDKNVINIIYEFWGRISNFYEVGDEVMLFNNVWSNQ